MAVTRLNGALAAYPVGSIYMSVSSTSPATLFGGTWERITGRFLLSATDGGSTGTNVQSTASAAPGASGGEAAHKLSKSEMPKHGHRLTQDYDTGESTTPASGGYLQIKTSPKKGSTGTVGEGYPGQLSYTGGDGAHNNIPPFLAVYVWKRTA